MRIAVVGGDLRFAHLAKLLAERGHDARALLLERARLPGLPMGDAQWLTSADLVMAGWPLRFPFGEVSPDPEVLLTDCGGKLVLCGPRPYAGEGALADLAEDADLLRENACLTAEGAVHAAMSAMDRTLCGSVCAVVGYGRIGQALAQLLRAMGALVTVITRNPARPRREGYRTADTRCPAGALSLCDAVFSTPPHPVLGETELSALPRGALVIDLASPPYGVDQEAAARLGLRAWRESGLPGRYCPRSAAQALLYALEEVLEREM